MFQYNTIANNDDTIQLSCIVDIKTLEANMTSIEFTDLKLFWDNDIYIFGRFKKYLKRYLLGYTRKKDRKEFKGISKIMSDEVAKELLDMLKLAKKQKWYTKKVKNDI